MDSPILTQQERSNFYGRRDPSAGQCRRSGRRGEGGKDRTKMNIAVVDAGANLKAFARMDGAWLGSIDIAIRKARTARFFDMNTGEIGKLSQPGGSLFAIEHSNGGLITFPGGVPIRDQGGTIIGAVGVSGSTVENDHAVAAAAHGWQMVRTALSTPRRREVHGVQKQKYQWVAANPVPSVLYDDEGLRSIFRQNRAAMPCSAFFCLLSVFSVSPWSTSVGTAS